MKNIIITGCAGFIGFHLTRRLLGFKKYNITGIDNMNNYYPTLLKEQRLKILKVISKKNNNFNFNNLDIKNKKKIDDLFNKNNPIIVINLAAQAGVRYSIEKPNVFLEDNILGFMNILEASRKFGTKRLIYASSSSVYGENKSPFSEKLNTDNPIQFYAVTKKTNELMANAWSSIYHIENIGLRFFTVYGPWGRPDMALYKFVKKIDNNQKIDLFNYGDHIRDFTYIDDIVEGILKSIQFNFDKNTSVPSKIFNLGSGSNIKLMKFIEIIEKNLNKEAKFNFLPMQQGDIHSSLADLTLSKKLLNYKPKIKPEKGIKYFIDWYKKYNGNKY